MHTTRMGASRQAGFTLIEIMIVVVIIAVLAAIVVPGFFRESSKAKHQTEVNAMFAEIAFRQEAYRSEGTYGYYYSIAQCPSTGPSQNGYTFTSTCTTGWTTLRVQSPNTTMYCSYQIVAGTYGTTPSPPTGFTMSTPSENWWYAVATCDMARDGGTNATFFVSSVDTKQQVQNLGK